MQKSTLGAQVWGLVTYLLMTGPTEQSSTKPHHDLGISRESAWHLGRRICEPWSKRGGSFGRVIEMDETCIGGNEHNGHESDNFKAGRRTHRNTTVVGGRDRQPNRIAAAPIDSVTQDGAGRLVSRTRSEDAMICSDDSAGSNQLGKHEAVNDSAGE